jgi:hypothetical protein
LRILVFMFPQRRLTRIPDETSVYHTLVTTYLSDASRNSVTQGSLSLDLCQSIKEIVDKNIGMAVKLCKLVASQSQGHPLS